MKRLAQTKGAKLRSAQEKAQRRNYQKNATKKTGVHPVPEPKPANLASLTAAPRKKRKPYKLHDRTIGALIRSINEFADAPMECHLGAAGVSRETFNQWRKQTTEASPKSEYGRQIARVDQAWRRLHEMAARQKPSEVLFRQAAQAPNRNYRPGQGAASLLTCQVPCPLESWLAGDHLLKLSEHLRVCLLRLIPWSPR
jgi:hypothetical protein